MELSPNQLFYLRALGRQAASVFRAQGWGDVAPRLRPLWDQTRADGPAWEIVEHLVRDAWESEKSAR